MLQALRDSAVAPVLASIDCSVARARLLALAEQLARLALRVERRRKLKHALRRIRASVEEHILHVLEELSVDVLILVLNHLSRVDDAHVHASNAGVVEERAVERAAHRLVAAEREGEVGHAARNLGARAHTLDLAGGVDEVDAVVVVLLHTGADGEDVRVEDDVLRVEAHLLHEDAVGARADANLLRLRGRLALLIERHHHNGGAVALDELPVADELVLTTLERDGVDDALALRALEARLDHVELARVDHERHLGRVRLGHKEVHKLGHRRHGVDEPVVHIDVDDVGARLHLLQSDGESLLVVAVHNRFLEDGGTGNVATLAEVDEGGAHVRRVRHVVVLHEAGETHDLLHVVRLARLELRRHLGERLDVLERRAAAPAEAVEEPLLEERAHLRRHLVALLVVAAHGVRQTSVRVREDVAVGAAREVLDVRDHVGGAERAVEPDGERLGVRHRVPERLVRLARQCAARIIDNGA
mmetsp:Transcript_4876/g.16886  ORF Transcript_4876/g.16886 Transcript_4876/m.16886 type:complete len:474 (+) Transcript_4876:1973-3394(+)